MANADMAESVDHAFMAEDAVGDRKLFDELGQIVRHGFFLPWQAASAAARGF